MKIYDENELAQDAYARLMLTGDPKVGKTVCALTTAPGPVFVLNCDGAGAPMAARRHGAEGLRIADVRSASDWKEGVDIALGMARKGQIRTIVVDTITFLINNVLTLEFGHKYSGFDIWREVMDKSLTGLDKLLGAKAHVIFVAHYQMDDGQIALNGNMKLTVPAMVHDRVHLKFDPKSKDQPRQLVIGPSADGLSGGRHSSENKNIEPNITKLLQELGYNTEGSSK